MKVKSVSKTYGSRTVLRMPEVSLEKGRVHVVLGANGSGKSTWAKILAGIIDADDRSCPFDKTYSTGYLPQRAYAFRMSTERNILIPSQDADRKERLMQTLRLAELKDARADKLSGGETARMALARVLMKKFDILILDEPSAAMDMESIRLSEQAVLDYRKETDAAVVLITHSIQQARRMGDTLFFLQDGKLAETGDCGALLHAPGSAALKNFLDFYGG